jgi:hypothetical protein
MKEKFCHVASLQKQLPTCASVKKCVEDRAELFPDMAELWHTSHVKPSAAAGTGSRASAPVSTLALVLLKMALASRFQRN